MADNTVIRGTFRDPPFTMEDLDEMLKRANDVEDKQIRTDLFRLIKELRRIKKEVGDG